MIHLWVIHYNSNLFLFFLFPSWDDVRNCWMTYFQRPIREKKEPVNTRQSCINTWENIDIYKKARRHADNCVFVRCVKFSRHYLTPDSKLSFVWQRVHQARSASTLQSKQMVMFKEVFRPWWEIAAQANYVVFVLFFLPCGNFSAQLMSKSKLIVARIDEVISQGNLKEN